MKKLVSLMLVCFAALVVTAAATEAQTSVSVDIQKARLQWTFNQGAGGVPSEFRVKCGQSTGTYTKTTVVSDPAARQIPVLNAITGPGNWFCAVSAANQFGDSPNSNEIAFNAGTAPVAPTGFQVVAQ